MVSFDINTTHEAITKSRLQTHPSPQSFPPPFDPYLLSPTSSCRSASTAIHYFVFSQFLYSHSHRVHTPFFMASFSKIGIRLITLAGHTSRGSLWLLATVHCVGVPCVHPLTVEGHSGCFQCLASGFQPTQQAGLCLWAPLSAQLSSGPLSSALPTPPSALLSSTLQPCHHVTPRALGGALFIESNCPQVCSGLVNQGQVRILATGTLILSPLHTSRILSSQSMGP